MPFFIIILNDRNLTVENYYYYYQFKFNQKKRNDCKRKIKTKFHWSFLIKHMITQFLPFTLGRISHFSSFFSLLSSSFFFFFLFISFIIYRIIFFRKLGNHWNEANTLVSFVYQMNVYEMSVCSSENFFFCS